jgi:hypothetical protein
MDGNMNASFMNKMTNPLKTFTQAGKKERKNMPLQEDYLTMPHQLTDYT